MRLNISLAIAAALAFSAAACSPGLPDPDHTRKGIDSFIARLDTDKPHPWSVEPIKPTLENRGISGLSMVSPSSLVRIAYTAVRHANHKRSIAISMYSFDFPVIIEEGKCVALVAKQEPVCKDLNDTEWRNVFDRALKHAEEKGHVTI